MTTVASRWVELAGTANTRDLGGLPAAGGTVRAGLLLRSDNLQDLTPADVRLLVDEIGVRTVLDLRTDSERRGEGPGPLRARSEVRHLHLSFIPDDRQVRADPGAVLPDRWADGAVGAYLHYLRDRPESFVGALRALLAQGAGGAVLHCAAGKDRTGVLTAVLLETLGVPRELVAADFAASNDRIEAIYGRLTGTSTYRNDVVRIGLDAHRVDPASLVAVLDILDEQHGGAAGYLRAAGASDAELAALRARLVS